MVRHHHKFMQKIFLLGPVLEHNFNKQAGNLFHLEQASLFQHICGDKISGFGGFSAIGDSQASTSAAKAGGIVAAYRRAKALLHPVTAGSIH
jgi:hypothetical protein